MSTTSDTPKRLTRREVERRLRDWKRRIEELFRQVAEWGVQEWGEASVVRGSRRQLNEYPMKQAGARPRDLPTLEFHVGERRILFVPSCLWIIRANGRVDALMGDRCYSLYDVGGENGEPSEWQITNPDPKVVLEPFTREVFLRNAKL